MKKIWIVDKQVEENKWLIFKNTFERVSFILVDVLM